MSDLFKVISIVGIRVSDVDFADRESAERAISAARYKPGFVFAALYFSRHAAPLSGRNFSLVKRQARGLKGSPKKPLDKPL